MPDNTLHAWPDTARFAIYAAPPSGSALAEVGHAWLGRDAESGRDLQPPKLWGLTPARWDELTIRARFYGFHGTFKAPFELASSTTAGELMEALDAFSATRAVVGSVPLTLARIAGFLALIPSAENPDLDALANACVAEFDRFRRPEMPDQVAKRRAGLSARQAALLDRWGYPYVFEEYRFHMTLTEPVPAEEASWLMGELAALLQPALIEPLRVEDLCLFAQTDRSAPFRLIRRFPLRG